MSVFDAVLLVVVAVQLVTGLRQGLVVGVCSITGGILGVVLAVAVLPAALTRLPGGASGQPLLRTLVAVIGVVAVAGLGRAVGSALGHRLRARRPGVLRTTDRLGGGALSAVGTLAVLWAVGVVVAASALPVLPGAVRDSALLARVDAGVPTGARDWVQRLSRQVDGGTYPALLQPFLTERIPAVAPPDTGVARSGAAARAATATVKVTGTAPACRTAVEGSGFVVDATHVVTNAHVVAGVDAPTVALEGASGPARNARFATEVVAFDPDLDVAVLALSGGARLPVAPLTVAAADLRTGAPAVVLGYPGDGPLTTSAARVRATQRIVGTDIRGQGRVVREVYTLRTVVRPGNSGGPMVDTAGAVAGLVFAMSRDDPQTGYALTAEQIAPTVRAGRARAATSAVDTGDCA